MLKKSILSLAVTASLAGMTGCQISSIDGNDDVDQIAIESGQPGYEVKGRTHVIFSAANSNLPLTTDLVFASAAATDGTAEVGNDSSVTAAVSDLDGFSTNAAIDIEVSSALDKATVKLGNVFLLELHSAPGVDSLDIQQILAATPTSGNHPFASQQLVPGVDYSVTYLELDGGKAPTIRINPLKPLTPKAKFLVVVTGRVLDAAGDPLRTSTEYEHLSTNDTILNDALQPVRDAIQGWEQLAVGALTKAGVTKDNIAASFTFTTGGTVDVLMGMAAPEVFLTAAVTGKVNAGMAAAGAPAQIKAGVEAGIKAEVEAGIAKAVKEGIATQVLTVAMVTADTTNIALLLAGTFPSQPVQDAYDAAITANYDAQYAGALAASYDDQYAIAYEANYQAQYDLAYEGIFRPQFDGAFNQLAAGVPVAIHAPQSRVFTPTGLKLPVTALPPLALSVSGATFTQGGLALPSFLKDVATDNSHFWSGNTTVATYLSLTGDDAVRDADGSNNVTYRFPFAEYVGEQVVPVLITYPSVTAVAGSTGYAAGGCPKPWKVAIYQHGITGDRTQSLGVADQLANNCIATVAMDHPMHGIAPLDGTTLNVNHVNMTDATKSPFAKAIETIVAADDTSPLKGINERHFDKTSDASSQPIDMVFTDDSAGFGSSGSLYINLSNFQRMRDTMRQGVLDLMNLNASLGAMDADADGGGADFDVANVTFIGHSLGAITGTTFVAMNNDSYVQNFRTDLPEIKTVILANPGAQLPKLLENSPSFAPRILPGLNAAAGLSQGDVNLEKFFAAFQATIDSVDPVSFAKKLVDDGTPVLMFEIAGDGTLANPSDTVVPVNATDAQILDLTAGLVDRAPSAFAPLVGTIGLTSQMGLTSIDASTVTTPVTGAAVQALTKFTKGNHGSFGGADAATAPAVFTEMMTQTITFILGSGMQAVAADTDVLEAAPAP